MKILADGSIFMLKLAHCLKTYSNFITLSIFMQKDLILTKNTHEILLITGIKNEST
ncbi:hypothetical protein FXW07_01585 [Methanosarcina sp. DH1]|uniref:hypothetical protein n=1 Tax=Methanosarcina sp. DH1 TaxID=2605695 RepID=UPI001E4E9C46|nr:hypothetical protein [Methanosarcina sp. DH1]MCC4765366.1 hypothetical protein [Methanosarcina sp. DH1]